MEQLILFGKYQILSTLGSGNFGTVYLAEHLKLKVPRAIKRIPKTMVFEPSISLEEDFLKEANLLKNLNHPGIPLIYDIDEDAQYVYMIEEFIQGESLETYVSHQRNISQELVIKIGIQLCDILDYLHHLLPYPILYLDLKPEHIILCGNQIKLIDFGISAFISDFEKHFQLYGTKGFTAPEIYHGKAASTAADIYGAGRILEFLTNASNEKISRSLLSCIHRATDLLPDRRYPSAIAFKTALSAVVPKPRQAAPHLIRNIAILGSRPGAGTTHIAISLACVLEKAGIPSLYQPYDKVDTLSRIAHSNPMFKESDGIYHFDNFHGIPDYGEGVSLSIPSDVCLIRDYGIEDTHLIDLTYMDYILYILTGSDWDISYCLKKANEFSLLPQIRFLCNHGNKTAAKRYAHLLQQPVYCFPHDSDPYKVTREKELLFTKIIKKKGAI